MVKHCKASNESHKGEKKREDLDRRESNQSVLARSECEAHVFQSNSN